MTTAQFGVLLWFVLIAWFVAGCVVSRNRRQRTRTVSASPSTGTPRSKPIRQTRQTGPAWEQDTPMIYEEDF